MFDSPTKRRGMLPNFVRESPKRRNSLKMGEIFRRRSISATAESSISDGSLLTVTDDERDHDTNQLSCTSFVSQATAQSSATGTKSLVQKIFESDAPCRLNSNLIVTVSNTWARMKRHEGYEEDVGEAIIICMMDLDPKTREKLRIKSFRSERFAQVCRAMSDLIDMVITLLGPDLDDEDLFEAGEGFREEGIDLELFSQCVSAGIQARLNKKHWNKHVESAWQETFKMLVPSMTIQNEFQ